MATSEHITPASAPLTVEQLRALMGEAVERLLAAMDALDAPDEDMEPYLADGPGNGCAIDAEADHAGGMADDEPSLGAPERHVPRKGQEAWADGHAPGPWEVDREIDGDESEPSLGAIAVSEHGSQERWSAGANDDTEDEHDGREPDVDDELGGDEEYSLGATTCTNQDHAWQNHFKDWSVPDGEPDLGWTEQRSGAGHPEMALGGYDDDREEDINDQPHDDVEPVGDLAGGCFRGQYWPSLIAIGDRGDVSIND